MSSVVLVFKYVGERSMAQNHSPVNLLIVVSKVFEEVISNRFLDYLDQDAAFCLASGLPGQLQIF